MPQTVLVIGLRRVGTAATLAVALLALPIFGGIGQDRSTPAGATASAAGTPAVEVAVGDRSYLVVEPPGGGAGLPVVVAVHGRTSSAAAFLDATGLGALATAGSAVVVAPVAAPAVVAAGPSAWNAGTCCDAAAALDVDDAGFVAAAVADAAARTGADGERVVLAGFSNGAMLGYRLACEQPGLLAALVAVAGTRLDGPCQPDPGLTLVHVHGDADGAVPLAGAAWSARLGTRLRSVPAAVAPFRAARAAVDVRVLPGQGHRWPAEATTAVEHLVATPSP